jgi:hypothetical protein
LDRPSDCWHQTRPAVSQKKIGENAVTERARPRAPRFSDALFGQEIGERVGERVHGGARQRRGTAEAGEIHRDHLVVGGQCADDRFPDLPPAADAVDQHQRFTAAFAMVLEDRHVRRSPIGTRFGSQTNSRRQPSVRIARGRGRGRDTARSGPSANRRL